ncbi:MAG: sodium/proline symporter [Cyanobacteria bacterium P01_G01_bin.19]
MFNDKLAIAFSFILFLLLFVCVGIYSSSLQKHTTTDYLLANRDVNPWMTGLSAFATAHSGGMFISTIGWTYQVGISSVWLLVGWFLGDYLAWFFVHKPLREISAEQSCETIGEFLAKDNQNQGIAVVSAIVTIAFLGAYAAAQLLAGSKALYAMFGWDYSWGIILGAVIVVTYCFSGGIRASIWTDVVQSVLMMVAMIILVIVALSACGGIDGLWQQLGAIDSSLVDPIPQGLQFGFGLFMLSWLIAGLGVVGQPHIMVRAMVIDKASNMGITRNIYAVAYVVFSTAAVLAGLSARVLLPNLISNGDPELALPQMAVQLLPAILVGVILAGIFSAVISTADSQILACSAALTQDLFPKMGKSYKLVKIGTLIVTAIVLAIALGSNKNMFALGVFAWSALASGLAPILILRVKRLPVSSATGIAMMVVGVATAAIWNGVLGLSGSIYEVLPGMAASFLVYGIARVLSVV